ncbi:MAG: glutamyl-tRNA reductase [Ignavibacteriales bacterium]
MNLIGISLNHKTAPIEIREALHLSKEESTELILKLKEKVFSSGFVLSTCNRTEIFGFPQNGKADFKPIIDVLLEFKHVENMKPENFMKYFSCSAVKHIFKVASGIDSLIIGDSQILGQTKEAFQLSEDLDFSDSVMKRIFDTAIKVGKLSIKETLIGEGAVTVSFAAVQVVEKIFSSLNNKSALVIGAGETGELAATHLRDKGIQLLSISNRTTERAEKLAQKLNAKVIPFDKVKESLSQYDIIFSATSAEGFILDYSDIKVAMKKRKGQPVCCMDIALPRDIDPKVSELDNVFYHDIDSLNIIVNQNLQKRHKEIPKVEKIIMDEMVNFFGWYNTLDVVPVIKAVREFFEEIGKDELEKIKNKLSDESFEKVEDMTRRLLGRLLHNPTMHLRQIAETGSNPNQVATISMMVKELFDLNSQSESKEDK